MIARLWRHPTLRQFVSFTCVGFAGMFGDMGALWLVTHVAGVGPYLGRVFSFLVASGITWGLNRNITFRHATKSDPLWREWMKFVAANAVGLAFNYATYALCITFVSFFAAHPVYAVVPGSAAGLLFNFTASKRLIYR